MNGEELLLMLETLLSLSESFKRDMSSGEFKLWQRISARVADIREGNESDSDPFTGDEHDGN